jgi:ABC-2 type transport system ATP-binding protein
VSAPVPPLVVESLVRRFGRIEAVAGVSLRVEPGRIVGFLGVNGAGKTTTLRCVAGLLAPDAGRIVVAGAELAREPRAARARLGFVPDRPHLHDPLTAREFLAFVAALYDLPAEAAERRAESLLERLGLAADAHRTLEGYSLGMRQKTAVIAALLHSPPLLLLDEPLTGLDPVATRTLKELLREHADAGGGVLVSTHLLDVAERLCDTVVILRAGRVVASGTLETLRAGTAARTLEDVFLELAREGPGTGASGPA